jgi:hypothetical protein
MPVTLHHEQWELLMPSSTRSWTVSCRACDLVIGVVVSGRFVHDPACPRPLAIGASVLRCCVCGGPLSGDPRPLAADDVADLTPIVPLLRFERSTARRGDARQRL